MIRLIRCMDFNRIVQKIKNDTWWSEEAPGNYQYAWAAWRAFTLQAQTFGRRHLSICLCLFKNDFGYEKTSEQEKLSEFWHVFREFRSTGAVADYRNFQKACRHLVKIGKKLDSRFHGNDRSSLCNQYNRVYAAYQDVVTHAVMPEASDIYTHNHLLADLRKESGQSFSSEEITDVALTLSSEPMLSFIEAHRRDFLRECLKPKPDWKIIERHYHWIQNNYLTPKYLNAEYFQKQARILKHKKSRMEIRKELLSLNTKTSRMSQRQKELLKSPRLTQKTLQIFAYLRHLSRWIDQRKAHMMQAVYYIDLLLQKISSLTDIPKSRLGYYTPEEIIKLLREEKTVPVKILASRRKLSVYVTWPKGKGIGEALFTGTNAAKIFKLFESSQAGEIKGMVACAPVFSFKGKVQVVLNPHKEKFIPCRILVTTMTRPDFVPLMRAASAIITDEGGITSHAAIISRELRIPCVIGAKIATKVLKDGQVVEMDLKTGEIEVV